MKSVPLHSSEPERHKHLHVHYANTLVVLNWFRANAFLVLSRRWNPVLFNVIHVGVEACMLCSIVEVLGTKWVASVDHILCTCKFAKLSDYKLKLDFVEANLGLWNSPMWVNSCQRQWADGHVKLCGKENSKRQCFKLSSYHILISALFEWIT